MIEHRKKNGSHFSLDLQLSLRDNPDQQITDNHIEDIVKLVQEAREEYRNGKCVASSADEIMADILS